MTPQKAHNLPIEDLVNNEGTESPHSEGQGQKNENKTFLPD
jgi:hypothetical protein